MQAEQYQLHEEIEDRHWWFIARRNLVTRVAKLAVPASGEAMVVDVGCGTGANLAAFASQYRCVGVDSSSEAINRARKRFPQMQFIEAQEPVDFRPTLGQANLVLLMDVLEHVERDDRFLAELVDVLRPGAQLVVTVPAGPDLWSEHDVSFGHYRRYTLQTLRALLSRLPVRPRLLSYFNARLYPLVKAARGLSRFRGKPIGEAGTDFWIPPAPLNSLLARILAGEANTLVGHVDRGGEPPYSFGVSLMALLDRVSMRDARLAACRSSSL